MSETLEPPEQPVFKLLEDYLTAVKILKSFEKKKPDEKFELQARASFLKISDMLDIELDKCADSAPGLIEPGSTTSAPL